MTRPAILAALLALGAAGPAFAETGAGPDAGRFGPGLRSIKIEARDFERSAAFYTALGMRLGTRREATWDLMWNGPTQNSGIVMTTTAYAERAGMVRGGTYLMVMTPDLPATIARLRGAGFADIAEPRSMAGMVSYVILRDPDGNRVELMGPPAAAK